MAQRSLLSLVNDSGATWAQVKAVMRAKDHQILFPLLVSQMTAKAKVAFVYNNKSFGIGWRTTTRVPVGDVTLPTPCKMKRPKA